MYDAGQERHYFLDEPASLSDGQMVIPVQWLEDEQRDIWVEVWNVETDTRTVRTSSFYKQSEAQKSPELDNDQRPRGYSNEGGWVKEKYARLRRWRFDTALVRGNCQQRISPAYAKSRSQIGRRRSLVFELHWYFWWRCLWKPVKKLEQTLEHLYEPSKFASQTSAPAVSYTLRFYFALCNSPRAISRCQKSHRVSNSKIMIS